MKNPSWTFDYDPFVTADGNRLYFDSNRPVEGKPNRDFDIWYVEKTISGRLSFVISHWQRTSDQRQITMDDQTCLSGSKRSESGWPI